MTDALGRLCDEGVAIWLDDLSRKRITSGNLAELIDRSQVVGVTTTRPSSRRRSRRVTGTSSSSATSPPDASRSRRPSA